MAVMDRVKSLVDSPKPTDIPGDVKGKTDRGRREKNKNAAKRRLCLRFEKGDTYWYESDKGMLVQQDTVTSASGGKPPHRIRNKHNFIRPIVEDKVSAATQRVPSYDINPSTTDPQDIGAARLAEKVALYGYDKWRVRKVTMKTVKLAIVVGEGFAMPYFDPNVGPFTTLTDPETGEPRVTGQGEIKIRTFSGNEVMWEPGVDFNDSRWYATEQALPVDEVRDFPGILPGVQVKADATTSEVPTDRDQANMVLVTDFFERPCQRYPRGRRLTMANNMVICAPETYPVVDARNNVLDEPVIHRLVYTLDPDNDRDLGLVWQLVDPQRSAQDCANKMLEWKNRCLNPQMTAQEGTIQRPPTDEPGSIVYYRPGAQPPQWQPTPPVPRELFEMRDMFITAMKDMAAYEDLSATQDVAAATVNTVIEQSKARWQSFIGDLAEWHSQLMRHCLLLVSRYYTEPRLLAIKGRFGPERVQDFMGSQLMDQIDVTVLPGSLDFRTKAQIQQQVLAYADRGWISPQQAMAAISGGSAEKLAESYELDVAKANSIIQKIRDGSVMKMPTRPENDPQTGEPIVGPDGLPAAVPTYMPGVADNPAVWKDVFGDWMKTEDFERLDPQGQEVANQIWMGIQSRQQQAEQSAALAQNQQAAALGMQNAAKPTMANQMPDQAGSPSQQPSNTAPPQ